MRGCGADRWEEGGRGSGAGKRTPPSRSWGASCTIQSGTGGIQSSLLVSSTVYYRRPRTLAAVGRGTVDGTDAVDVDGIGVKRAVGVSQVRPPQVAADAAPAPVGCVPHLKLVVVDRRAVGAVPVLHHEGPGELHLGAAERRRGQYGLVRNVGGCLHGDSSRPVAFICNLGTVRRADLVVVGRPCCKRSGSHRCCLHLLCRYTVFGSHW